MAQRSQPGFDLDVGQRRGSQSRHGGLHIAQGGAGDLEQIPVQPFAFVGRAAKLDRLAALLGPTAVIAPVQPGQQIVGLGQQTHHHTYAVPQQTAVARRVDRGIRHRAVDPQHLAALDLGLPGLLQQVAIDPLPGLRADRADRVLQDRFLRCPVHRQTGEGPERGRVGKVERQLLVAQLAMLFQHPAAQHRFRRQTLAAGRLEPVPAQLRGNPTADLAMIVQQIGHRLQLTTKLVL